MTVTTHPALGMRGRAGLAGLLLALPALATAATQTFHCGFNHYLRTSNGGELVSTTLSVRNLDPMYAATILRLTVRDGEGQVVYDAGPLTPTPLPLNNDFPGSAPQGKDIGSVPPLGAVYLRSNHLWGNGSLPGVYGNELGQMMGLAVVIAKEGPRNALVVAGTQRMRTRVPNPNAVGFIETDTRATGTTVCESLP